jgi:hypothetical protein
MLYKAREMRILEWLEALGRHTRPQDLGTEDLIHILPLSRGTKTLFSLRMGMAEKGTGTWNLRVERGERGEMCFASTV